MGQILKKIIVARLNHYVLPGISSRQYGFMPQRCTEDSLYNLMRHIREKLESKKLISLVSLDIKGAVDSAWWPAIKVRSAETSCPTNIRSILGSYVEVEKETRLRHRPVSFVKRTASVTKLFSPIASEAYSVIRNFIMTKEVAQALTGHGGFS